MTNEPLRAATPALEGAAEALARRFSIVDSQGAFKVEEVAAELRKHFNSPAPEGELARVKGRLAKVITHPNLGAAITDGCFWLGEDGEWRIGTSWTEKYKFPDADAAAAFLAAHADQPAAVSPAAPAEQGDELTALRQLNIDHCADEERIKELALPILGEKRVNGEGYFVSSLQVVEMLVEELASLHPADEDLEIDEAWLRSVGLKHSDGGWYITIASGPNRLYWVGGLVSISRDGHKHVSLCTGINTRGQLRRLCQALGITLTAKEPTNG